MKKVYILLTCLLPLAGIAQNNKGKVIYSEKIKLDIDLKLDGIENADAIRAMLPKEQTSKKVLIFNEEASLFKNLEKEENENNIVSEGNENVNIKMVISKPEEETYRDIKNNKVIEKQDLFGKTFLITDNTPKTPWKLTNETKVILGYNCTKAVIKDSTQNIEAWFTSSIPVSSGPGHFGQLPGMILEMSADSGKYTIVATEVMLGENTEKIIAPTKGKAVTRAEFDKIAQEKSREMNENEGGSRVIIKRN